MYPSINAHHVCFVIDSATLQPYIDGEQPLTDLEPSVAAHVATLCDWQALHAITHPPAATFADLDPRSQAIYRAIAAALPGYQVYATGSRVRGTWRSGAPDDPKTTIAMRLSKSAESDVDVIVLDTDNNTFRRAVAAIAAAFGVRIDRQPATLQPQIHIPKSEAHLLPPRPPLGLEQMRSKAEAHLFEQMRSKEEE